MELYWYKFKGLPVTHHLLRDMKSVWTGIYGVQIGKVFIGVIIGGKIPITPQKEANNE